MGQFDVYDNPNPTTSSSIPYLLDVQVDLLEDLATRVVVPLVAAKVMRKPAKHLNPLFSISGQQVVMSTAELAGISRKDMGDKITSLADHRDEIIGALDFLFTGF